jgi:hypothetical protein
MKPIPDFDLKVCKVFHRPLGNWTFDTRETLKAWDREPLRRVWVHRCAKCGALREVPWR